MQNVAIEDTEGNWTENLEENCRSDLFDAIFMVEQVVVISSLMPCDISVYHET